MAVALKLIVIFAMLGGLFVYAGSTASRAPSTAAVESIAKRMEKMGYVKVRETREPRGVLVESFELHTVSKPHFHSLAWIDLISRNGALVQFAHGEDTSDVAD